MIRKIRWSVAYIATIIALFTTIGGALALIGGRPPEDTLAVFLCAIALALVPYLLNRSLDEIKN